MYRRVFNLINILSYNTVWNLHDTILYHMIYSIVSYHTSIYCISMKIITMIFICGKGGLIKTMPRLSEFCYLRLPRFLRYYLMCMTISCTRHITCTRFIFLCKWFIFSHYHRCKIGYNIYLLSSRVPLYEAREGILHVRR